MIATQNTSLTDLNTFGFSYTAKSVFFIATPADLTTLYSEQKWFRQGDFLPLGGGSNILLTKDVDIPVVAIRIDEAISTLEETETSITLEVGAGKNWHDWVIWTIENNFGGLENLSLIPGQVGAAPMQNIGAYGVEVKDTLESVVAFEVRTGKTRIFSAAECELGYRESVFKRKLKGQYLITHVRFRLTKKEHQLRTHYGAIEAELEQMQVQQPTIKDISNAVIAIRKSKLPDPKKLGNSGSFFKNPVVSIEQFELLKATFPAIVGYPSGDGVKLAAGWLIEQAGWKGKQMGPVGVHKRQALVLVHYGGGTGEQLLELAKNVQESVLKKFGVKLEPEVNIL